MADQVTNYQCPACGGPLRFDEKSGKLVCDYCGSVYDPPEIEAYYAEKDRKAAETQRREEQKKEKERQDRSAAEGNAAGTEKVKKSGQCDSDSWDFTSVSTDWGADAANMRVYTCPSCGAELICDATTAATSCPYCGNPTIIPGQFTGAMKPEYVLPFKQDKEAAVSALKRHYGGKVLLPGAFKSQNHLEEVKGIYVPFWLFDAGAYGSAMFEGTRTHVHRSGDYEITETEHFDIYREGSLNFEKVPVDGSSKMDDDYMDSIEPYAYADLKAFSTAYLPGFFADKYDVSDQECAAHAENRCRNTLVSELSNTVMGYDTVIPKGSNVNLQRRGVHYALMPVWVLSTRWNGKNYMFMMNGQTGKMVGDLPVSWGKFWLMFLIIAAVLTIIFVLAGGVFS